MAAANKQRYTHHANRTFNWINCAWQRISLRSHAHLKFLFHSKFGCNAHHPLKKTNKKKNPTTLFHATANTGTVFTPMFVGGEKLIMGWVTTTAWTLECRSLPCGSSSRSSSSSKHRPKDWQEEHYCWKGSIVPDLSLKQFKPEIRFRPNTDTVHPSKNYPNVVREGAPPTGKKMNSSFEKNICPSQISSHIINVT